MIEDPFKKPESKEVAKPQKQEKSQAELRNALKERFSSLEVAIKQEMSEYKTSLADDSFEDKEGEEAGSGERRKEAIQTKINASLDRAEQMKAILDSNNPLPQYESEIQTTYQTESITIDLDQKIQEFKDFYQTNKIDTPADFEDQIKEIWGNNVDAIQKAIEENGFDDILLMPASIPLPDLHSKMTEGYVATYQSENFTAGGSFTGAKSQNVDKPRIVLVHKTQNLKDRPELAKTLNTKGQDLNLDHLLTLEDYLVFQRKYFKETNKYLDEEGWTWLATKSGARLVYAYWAPSAGQVNVHALDLDFQHASLGARPSRSFF